MGSTATTAFPTEAGHGKQNNIVQMKAHPEWDAGAQSYSGWLSSGKPLPSGQ